MHTAATSTHLKALALNYKPSFNGFILVPKISFPTIDFNWAGLYTTTAHILMAQGYENSNSMYCRCKNASSSLFVTMRTILLKARDGPTLLAYNPPSAPLTMHRQISLTHLVAAAQNGSSFIKYYIARAIDEIATCSRAQLGGRLSTVCLHFMDSHMDATGKRGSIKLQIYG